MLPLFLAIVSADPLTPDHVVFTAPDRLVIQHLGRVVFDGKIVVGGGGRPTVTVSVERSKPKPVYLGYPHGPETDEFVPEGRMAQKLVVRILAPDDGAIVTGAVRASREGVPCSLDPAPNVVRSAATRASSSLDHAVYDRQGDWLLSAEGGRVSAGDRGKIRLTAEGKELTLTLFADYYRDHLGYFLWDWRTPVWSRPVAGWCSWMAHGQRVTEEDMVRAATFFSKRLRAYGYDVVQMDDGFQRVPQMEDEAPTTSEPIADLWTKPNAKFPSGLDGLAKRIRETGMTPGIWVGLYTPLGMKADGYVKGEDGKPYRGPWVNFAANALVPEALEEAYLQTFRRLKKQGWNYFKVDTLRHLLYDSYRQNPAYWRERGENPERAFRTLLTSIKKVAGRNTYTMACWGALPDLAGVADGCRIGEDVSPDWSSIEKVGKYLSRFNYLNGVVWRNDPDYMCFRATVERCRSWASIVALTGSQTMVSDPMEAYDEARLDILRRVGPPVVAKPRTLTQLERKDYWSLQGAKGGEEWTVVARVAWKDLPAERVNLGDLGLEPHQDYLAFDFWNERFLGVVRGFARFQPLAQGDCRVVSFRKRLNRPQVLGDNRHIGQGVVELRNLSWKGNVLSGRMALGPGRSYSLYIHVPDGYEATEIAPASAKAERQGGVLKLTFPESERPAEWRVAFRRR